MSVSDSESCIYEHDEIPPLNQSYYVFYLSTYKIKTFVLFDENQFILYGSKMNMNNTETPFYAKYSVYMLNKLVEFLYFIFRRFDEEINLSLYVVQLDKNSLCDYGIDFIYNKCGDEECLIDYPLCKMNMKKLTKLLVMIKQ